MNAECRKGCNSIAGCGGRGGHDRVRVPSVVGIEKIDNFYTLTSPDVACSI